MGSTTTNDSQRIRVIATALLDKEEVDDASIDRGAQLLKLASETENQQAQAAKFAAEEQKLKDDLSDSSSRRKPEDWKTFISILTPLFTTVVLAGTLVVQSCQFKQQRTDAANAAEDLRWSEAMKVLAGQKQLSPTGVLLATFSTSPRYRDLARDMAEKLLTTSTSQDDFSAVFHNLFEPVDWRNLKWILDADRSIWDNERGLSAKTWNKETGENDLIPLSAAEQAAQNLAVWEIQKLGSNVGQLLKGQRPKDVALDLTGTGFWHCDWKGADLSGADLTGIHLFRVDLDGANLSEIAKFRGSNIEASNWWNAAAISPEFLEHLLSDEASRYNPNYLYGSGERRISQADYEAALTKLKKVSSIP